MVLLPCENILGRRSHRSPKIRGTPMTNSMKNLDVLTKLVNRLSVSPKSEEVVRNLLVEWAKDAPLHVIEKMGRAIIECRAAELKSEAESN